MLRSQILFFLSEPSTEMTYQLFQREPSAIWRLYLICKSVCVFVPLSLSQRPTRVFRHYIGFTSLPGATWRECSFANRAALCSALWDRAPQEIFVNFIAAKRHLFRSLMAVFSFFPPPAVVPLAGLEWGNCIAPCFLIEKSCQKKSLFRDKDPVFHWAQN